MEESKPQSFASNNDTKVTNTESYSPPENRAMNGSGEGIFVPRDPQFQVRQSNANLLHMLAQQEPRHADPAPTPAEIDFHNFRRNSSLGSDLLFDDVEQNGTHNFYGGGRAESVSSSNMWTEGSGVSASRNGELIDTFDFLVKSLSSANNYVSMLTRDQMSVLRSIRPGLLYEFLQEVAKVRGDKRMRRALPNECAFCKNNGENEECYTGHVLKDWRGRVQCPVLRAFRCPRCGATGDRAHTIKYCQENLEHGSERVGLSARRRGQMPFNPLLLPQELQALGLRSPTSPAPPSAPAHTPAPPAPSPSPSTSRPGVMNFPTIWEYKHE